jgi:outer membrane protein OmpA-like peptidoglycan-associated protein
MSDFRMLRAQLSMVILFLVSVLFGCAGMGLEYAPKGQYLYYHVELPAAERAVEAARRAGKDKECPEEFKTVEMMGNKAYEVYWACRTNEAIAISNEVVKRAYALCPPKKVVLPPPAPSVSLSASPATIQQGQCATLTWSSANAASASIDQGVGKVSVSGSWPVCPRSTTPYTIAAVGEGGTRSASTTVSVTPPPAPTVSLSASPAMIQQGQCATLLWSSANAASASIDQGVGSVDLSGLRQVCPTTTTPYTIAAAGEGGTRSASTTVTVTPLPPVAPKVIDRLTLHVNFDFDKSNIRNADTAELQRAVDFVTKYSGYKISIEGHTDSIGTEKYNQGLSERRAAAVKEHLLKHRVADGARIKSAGYGKSKPIADNSTEKGRFENRRVEILILSE